MEALSEDLLVEILAKVPVKPLLRLRTVCNSWNSIIASPEFRSLHLSTNRRHSKILLTTKHPLISNHYHPVERYLLLDNDHHRPADHSWLASLDFPFQYPVFTSPHIVASINGLICVYVAPTLTPAFEVQVNIRPYHPEAHDYKIVVLTLDKAPEFNVYSLNSNTWRRGFLDRQIKLISSTGAFVGRKMHWLVCKDFECLYSFDVAEEVFAEVALPPKDRATGSSVKVFPHVIVTVLGESLLLGQASNNSWTIWVQIGAGGWKKLYRVEDPMGLPTVFVCVLKNGGLVVDKYYYPGPYYGLAAYDPKGRQFKFLEPLSLSQQRNFGGVASVNDYQESLVLIDCTPLGDKHPSCSNWSCQAQIKRNTPSTLVAPANFKSKGRHPREKN
ncbi:F-box and associated interaction domains-containing protein [Striga asiatica]|uniref:F-box and associated interaction domains-containing protein n=1 Tax=Striga asiatica TaxID=4170 RepID=A0A5A7QU10_STRAF|nr:F-box and associated interaction domains-containing protein [Striga asiatica]